jgi:flagellar hook-associated protein 1 FlgK
MSGIDALNIAKNAMLSHQAAINLTGTNIANVNTPGYTRQRPVFSASSSQSVEIANIERIYDRFLGAQINEQMYNLGYSEAKKEELGRIEMIFNEADGGGISELLNKFWSAWEDLSANPSGQAERQALVSVAQSLTSMFRSYSGELLSVQDDANTRIQDLAHQVNGYLSDIADINSRMTRTEADEIGLNTLKDKRAELLSGLAEIVDFHYFEDSDGAINIFLSNGMPLVEGSQTWELDVVTGNHSNSSFYDVVFKDDPDEEVINSVITNGKLAGLLEIRDTTAKGYMDSLDDLAAAIVLEVNTQHSLGYDTNQNLGGDFFDAAKTKAKDMEVSADIIADVNKIAASETVNGDGGNAVSISAIKDELTMNGGKSTFSAYYSSSLMGRIGQDVADANRNFDHHTNLMSQLKNKREEISGVSIDEEMMNLIRYQTGYEAAAKFFSTADELMDTLMNLVR